MVEWNIGATGKLIQQFQQAASDQPQDAFAYFGDTLIGLADGKATVFPKQGMYPSPSSLWNIGKLWKRD